MFRDALPAIDKYPVRECQNLSSPIEMKLCLKPKTFSSSFFPFLEAISNYKHFEYEDDRHSYFISEIVDWQRFG